MKYLKTYEKLNINPKPKIGDYVVCFEDRYSIICSELVRKLDKFLSENVGLVKKADDEYNYLIQYQNYPEYLAKGFQFGYLNGGRIPNCRTMTIEEIIYWSSNKNDCETFIAAKKYNL